MRRRRFFTLVSGVYVGLAVAVAGLTLLEFVKQGELSIPLLITGGVILASFWLPVVRLRTIRSELNRRAMEE